MVHGAKFRNLPFASAVDFSLQGHQVDHHVEDVKDDIMSFSGVAWSSPSSGCRFRHGGSRGLSTSFFIDCSASTGLPEGTSPPVFCGGKACMTYDEECGWIRRALESKTMKNKVTCMWDTTAFVHFLDGDIYLKCCVKGKTKGLEQALCEVVVPKALPKPIPPPLPEPLPKGTVAIAKWAVKKLATSMKTALKNLFGGKCGWSACNAFGEMPPPVCLHALSGKDTCMYWGSSGMPWPENPLKGAQSYKVFQLSIPICQENLMLFMDGSTAALQGQSFGPTAGCTKLPVADAPVTAVATEKTEHFERAHDMPRAVRSTQCSRIPSHAADFL